MLGGLVAQTGSSFSPQKPPQPDFVHSRGSALFRVPDDLCTATCNATAQPTPPQSSQQQFPHIAKPFSEAPSPLDSRSRRSCSLTDCFLSVFFVYFEALHAFLFSLYIYFQGDPTPTRPSNSLCPDNTQVSIFSLGLCSECSASTSHWLPGISTRTPSSPTYMAKSGLLPQIYSSPFLAQEVPPLV